MRSKEIHHENHEEKSDAAANRWTCSVGCYGITGRFLETASGLACKGQWPARLPFYGGLHNLGHERADYSLATGSGRLHPRAPGRGRNMEKRDGRGIEWTG